MDSGLLDALQHNLTPLQYWHHLGRKGQPSEKIGLRNSPHLPHIFSTRQVVVCAKHLFHQLEVANGDPTLEKRSSDHGADVGAPISEPKLSHIFRRIKRCVFKQDQSFHNDGQTDTWIGSKTSFFRCGRKAAQKKYGEIKAAQSNAMLGTRIHPRASI